MVSLGEELAKRLRAKGYQVWHDTTAYDMKSGHLDRSRAYTYACEGVTNLLQKYPSIQVILDVHRDGVSEQTHLVTQIEGKPTAQIMFFNGTSETPDGPIEYLANPCRKENLAFSFQMKWNADQIYPGFTRTIYLKGLRYNLHLRPRSALIEVGAQTNTYEEAVNAMDPLAQLSGSGADRLMARLLVKAFSISGLAAIPEKMVYSFRSGVIYYKDDFK